MNADFFDPHSIDNRPLLSRIIVSSATFILVAIILGACIGFVVGFKVSEIRCHDKKVERIKGK